MDILSSIESYSEHPISKAITKHIKTKGYTCRVKVEDVKVLSGFGVMLTPVYAGITMSFSSVSVVLNSLRLKFFKL